MPRCLRLGFRLSVCCHRLVTKDYDFPVPMFVLLCQSGENAFIAGEVLTAETTLERRAQKKCKSRAGWKLPAAKDWICAQRLHCHRRGKRQETETGPKCALGNGKRCRTGEANRTGT